MRTKRLDLHLTGTRKRRATRTTGVSVDQTISDCRRPLNSPGHVYLAGSGNVVGKLLNLGERKADQRDTSGRELLGFGLRRGPFDGTFLAAWIELGCGT